MSDLATLAASPAVVAWEAVMFDSETPRAVKDALSRCALVQAGNADAYRAGDSQRLARYLAVRDDNHARLVAELLNLKLSTAL